MVLGKISSSKKYHIIKKNTSLCSQIFTKDIRVKTVLVDEFKNLPLCHNCEYIYKNLYNRHFK